MKSGVRIPRATLNSLVGHMAESRHIEQFFFQQGSSDNLVLTVHPKPGFDPRVVERIRHELATVLGAHAEISVKIAGSLAEDSTND